MGIIVLTGVRQEFLGSLMLIVKLGRIRPILVEIFSCAQR